MSDFTKCPDCGNYDFRSTHKCEPKWKVFYGSCSEKDYSVIHAINYQYAAENFAADYECSNVDYSLMNGDSMEVQVEPFNSGERKTFIVTGEAIPTYHAKEKNDKNSNG